MARMVGGFRVLGVLACVGVVATVLAGPTAVRPWIAAAAAVSGWLFVAVYSRRRWRSTYPGRAAMVFTVAVTAVLTNATAVLLWPEYGYPAWEYVTTFVYLGVGLAMVYKLGALLGARSVE